MKSRACQNNSQIAQIGRTCAHGAPSSRSITSSGIPHVSRFVSIWKPAALMGGNALLLFHPGPKGTNLQFQDSTPSCRLRSVISTAGRMPETPDIGSIFDTPV